MKKDFDERTANLLKKLVDQYWLEDQAVRETQVRKWRRLKLLWEGFSRTWYSEVAHDWRIYDPSFADDNGQQDYYDKPINIFRAYLESIIAALSITVPPIKCYPDDADDTLDILTAKAGDKIAKLIYRHNDVSLVWLQAMFIYCTEGMVAACSQTIKDEAYGTYDENEYENVTELHEVKFCSNCGFNLADTVLSENLADQFNPDDSDVEAQSFVQQEEELCPECAQMMVPELQTTPLVVTRIIGVTKQPKSRQKIDVYGGLCVKIPNYARKMADCPYLFYSEEIHYTKARQEYPNIRNLIQPGYGGTKEPYERWARMNPQYQGEMPMDTVTSRKVWLRPFSFEALNEDECNELKKKFPNGAKVCLIDDNVAEYRNESLDDYWTITFNPFSDFVTFDPLGSMLTSVQDITNDIISLTVQTMEHGIPQTFADPAVLNFNEYGQQETTPGAIYPATPKSGRGMSDSFYEVKTATLSQEIMPFAQQIQSLGQLVTGALPSLFGGDIQGSKTASQYSMSRAQALQRLQNTWKMFTSWWKQIFGKVIIAYIKEIQDDEKFVEKDSSGNFINIVIHRAELEGKLGQIELEANENLPITFAQQKDIIMQLMQASNPQIMQLIASPENLPLIYEAMGIPDLYVPGEDSRNKQYDEIKELLATEPIEVPPDMMMVQESMVMGMPLPPPEPQSSVEVGEFDNHAIELEICIKWLNSEAGRQAKFENQAGYQNVLLHAKAHKDAIMMQAMEQAMQMAPEGEGATPLEKPKETDQEAPIMGEGNVQVN